MVRLGRHVVALFTQCSKNLLQDERLFTDSVVKTVNNSGLNVIKHYAHYYDPYGTTLFWILTESHLIVHTWPEYDTFEVDLLVCQDDFNIDEFISKLGKLGEAQKTDIMIAFEK